MALRQPKLSQSRWRSIDPGGPHASQMRRLRPLEVEPGQEGGSARHPFSSGYERSDSGSETRPGRVWHRHSSVVDGEKSGSSKGLSADSAAVGSGTDYSLCAILEPLTADAKSSSAARLSRRIPGKRSRSPPKERCCYRIFLISIPYADIGSVTIGTGTRNQIQFMDGRQTGGNRFGPHPLRGCEFDRPPKRAS